MIDEKTLVVRLGYVVNVHISMLPVGASAASRRRIFRI